MTDLPDLSDPLESNWFLHITDRLIPAPYSGRDPEYVWDIVLRRSPSGDRPQAALFVRRIDARIAVPDGVSLSDVLVQGAGTDDPVLPVALDPTTGRRVVDTGDSGAGFVYAAPQTLNVQVFNDRLDWLVFEDADNPFLDTSISQAARPGQELVDNTGTVRRVIELVNDPEARDLGNDALVVRVEPPFQPVHGPEELADGYDADANDPPESATPARRRAAYASWVRQVVFTPRPPVAVRVFNLEDPS